MTVNPMSKSPVPPPPLWAVPQQRVAGDVSGAMKRARTMVHPSNAAVPERVAAALRALLEAGPTGSINLGQQIKQLTIEVMPKAIGLTVDTFGSPNQHFVHEDGEPEKEGA
jgi:hypothetical protein